MIFTRSKQIVFFNNKWWVWKTTLAYNTAVKMAEKGYKTVLIDLDPQCNLSTLALWDSFAENRNDNKDNIYWVLEWVIKWWSDINLNIDFKELQNNLSILPWSLKLSLYQDILGIAYFQANAWQESWYFQTSAISRFLEKKWMSEEIDIFIIDISPSLDILNRVILLWSDYFLTPLMPDLFSMQWIENIWPSLNKWKTEWKNWWKALARSNDIASSKVLNWESLFIWYLINSYNQYKNREIKSHSEWIKKIPKYVKKYLSELHCKNWLVEQSWKNPLSKIKDYWELTADWQKHNKAIFTM